MPRVFGPSVHIKFVAVFAAFLDVERNRVRAVSVGSHFIIGVADGILPIVKIADDIDVEIGRAARTDVRVLVEVDKCRSAIAVIFAVAAVAAVAVVAAVAGIGTRLDAQTVGIFGIAVCAVFADKTQIVFVTRIADANAVIAQTPVTARRVLIFGIVGTADGASRQSKAKD